MAVLNKKIKKIILVTVVLLFIYVLVYNNKKAETDRVVVGPTLSPILYHKRAIGMGNCPPNDFCTFEETLYQSGEYVENSPTTEGDGIRKTIRKSFSKEQIIKVEEEIDRSGLLEKECFGEKPALDYWVKHDLNYKNKTIQIMFPNCKEELERIDKVVSDTAKEAKNEY